MKHIPATKAQWHNGFTKLFFMLLCILLFFPQKLSSQNSMEINLNNNWKFRKAGDTVWLPATVPGCVHTDLHANKLIPDPFYADNEKQVQWIENEDWEYQTVFSVDKKMMRKDIIEIQFSGLDTYADVYLNESLILKADNMFRSWNVDVKKYLHDGENKLHIKFSSAVRIGKELMNNYPVKLPGDERVFTRKAQYQYGWDWGPRLVTAGIWKDVSLICKNQNDVLIQNISTAKLNDENAELSLALFHKSDKTAKYKIKIRNMQTGEYYFKTDVHLSSENNAIHFSIQNPKLWWCNGFGKAHLYELEISVSQGLKHITSKSIKFGIRNIELVQEPDSAGKSFYFKVNGKPVFAKGANIIPLHSFPSSITKEDYKKLLLEAKNMNMNLLRVWGGGMYEDDFFYGVCDSLGIMVWQDFMFACGMYPLDNMHENAKIEIEEMLHRYEQHPSLALLCGNNEIDEGWKNWGWQKQFNYSASDSSTIYAEYNTWFNKKIPDILKQNTAPVYYHPSSPTHGWGRKESLLEGDAHYWGVWWGKEPFEKYNEKIPRFMSEYGFQGMACYNSFKQFIPANELTGTALEILQKPSIKNHQKHPVGYETIDEYMARDYKVPTDFEDYIYVSQLLQARGMQTAIEAHRRNMPYCMGTLYWQLNDCWPVTSWSTVDFYGNRKASYYTVKEKYKEVMISVLKDADTITIFFVNDRPEPIPAIFEYHLLSTNGEIIYSEISETELNSQTAYRHMSVAEKDVLLNNTPENCFLYLKLRCGDSILAETIFAFVSPKKLVLNRANPEIKFDSTQNELIITAPNLILNMYLYSEDTELKLSDNFFTVFPGKEKRIYIEEKFTEKDLQSLRFNTLNHINLQYE